MGRHSATSRKGKHRAPSRIEAFLRPSRSSLRGNLLPLAVIALTGIGVTWAFNEGVKDGLRHQQRSAPDPFIYSCGDVLCESGSVFTPQPKVVCSDALKDPKVIVDEAIRDKQNTIEISSLTPQNQSKEDINLNNVLQLTDSTIAEARRSNMHVILNLSDFVIKLSANSDKQGAAQWKNTVESMGGHVNKATGLAYAQDPTIMMIKLSPDTKCSGDSATTDLNLEPQVVHAAEDAFPHQIVEP